MESGSARWAALDVFRGAVVFLMLPVNAAMGFAAIPRWFKHAPEQGVTMPDFIMPAFLVALGISSSLSLRRRVAARGIARTCAHALLRYGLLFSFGTIGFFLVWKGRNWEILQMLGITGALAFPFLFLAPPWRMAATAGILLGVEALRPLFFDGAYRAWYESGIGGPAGSFALAALPVAASALGELLAPKPWKKRAAFAAAVGAGAAAAGLLASLYLPLNKHLLSISYLALTFGAALLALAAVEILLGIVGKDIPPLGALGRNPLFAYMAGGILTLGVQALLPPDSAAPAAWAASLAVLALISAACAVMDARRLWIKL